MGQFNEDALSKFNETYRGSQVLKCPEIFSPLECEKIRIGAIEILVLKNVWSFIHLFT